jgi:hypothetical protein
MGNDLRRSGRLFASDSTVKHQHNVIVREGGRSSIPETAVLTRDASGILDALPEPVIGRAFARPVGGA